MQPQWLRYIAPIWFEIFFFFFNIQELIIDLIWSFFHHFQLPLLLAAWAQAKFSTCSMKWHSHRSCLLWNLTAETLVITISRDLQLNSCLTRSVSQHLSAWPRHIRLFLFWQRFYTGVTTLTYEGFCWNSLLCSSNWYKQHWQKNVLLKLT